MLLQDLLYKTSVNAVNGSTAIPINALQIDSRAIQKGNCFIAIKGTGADGHSFINAAIKNGALAIVCEEMPDKPVNNVTYIQVNDSAEAAGIMAHLFLKSPL